MLIGARRIAMFVSVVIASLSVTLFLALLLIDSTALLWETTVVPAEWIKRESAAGGFAYVWMFDGAPADTAAAPDRSRVILFEDEKALASPHSIHANIRSVGLGRYSHWDDGTSRYIIFSASDNSDPRSNGRSYTIRYPPPSLARLGESTKRIIVILSGVLLACLLFVARVDLHLRTWFSALPAALRRELWDDPRTPPQISEAEGSSGSNAPITGRLHAAQIRQVASRGPLAPMILSLSLGLFYWLSVPVSEPTSDAMLYHRLGRSISGHPDEYFAVPGRTMTGLYVRGVTYPTFLAFIFWLTRGPHVGVVTFVQSVLFLPSIVFLTYLAGRKAFSRRAGVLSAWLLAIWLPLVWHTAWILTEIWQTTLMSLLTYCLASLLLDGGRLKAGLIGALVCVVSISHCAYQFLPWVLTGAIVIHYRKTLRQRSSELVGWGIGMILVLVPFHLIRLSLDLPSLGEGGKGYGGGGAWAFYVGSRAATDWRVIPDDFVYSDLTTPETFQRVAERIESGEIRMEPFMRRIFTERLSDPDPNQRYIRQWDFYEAGLLNWSRTWYRLPDMLWTKAGRLFCAARGIGPEWIPLSSPISTRLLTIKWYWVNRLLLLLVLTGLWRVVSRRPDRFVLFVPFLFQAALFLASEPAWRYTYPLTPSMILLAAYALSPRAAPAIPSAGPST